MAKAYPPLHPLYPDGNDDNPRLETYAQLLYDFDPKVRKFYCYPGGPRTHQTIPWAEFHDQQKYRRMARMFFDKLGADLGEKFNSFLLTTLP